MRTVAELFSRLEQRQLTYAVLRNYEHFPDLRGGDRTRNTDIDLVVRRRELPQLRELLISVADEFGWDVLTECGHYARSRVRHHNIEVFQFYRKSPLEYLQVDVFHGFLAWGLPFMDEEEMLRGRQYDPVRNLTHIDPLKEQTYRLVQIHGLGQSARTAGKRKLYRLKIDAFRETRDQEYLATVRRYFGRFGIEAAAALRAGDVAAFNRAVWLGKRHFCLHYVLRHPLAALLEITARRRESRLRCNTDPCGCTLAVHASTAAARARFDSAMKVLIEMNVIDEWLVASGQWSAVRAQDILEQGGVLVEWTDPDRAALVIGPGDDPREIAVNVMNACAGRHQPLYVKQTARVRECHLSLAQR